MNMIHEMDGVAHVEEISRFAVDESAACDFEVAVADVGTAWRVRTFAAGAAMLMDASTEFADSC